MTATTSDSRMDQIRRQAQLNAANAPLLTPHIKDRISVLLAPRIGGGGK